MAAAGRDLGRVFYEAFRVAGDGRFRGLILPDWGGLSAEDRENFRAGADAVLMYADLAARPAGEPQ